MAAPQRTETPQAEKPKRAKSAYFLFCDARRADAAEANRAKNGGKLKMTELSKELSELWKQAGEEEKAKFETLAAEEKTRHAAAMTEYEEATKIEGLMKRPQSAYFQFINARRAKIMEEYKLSGIAEVGKKAAELWKAMSAEEKKPFEEQFAKDKAAYEAWKESDAGKAALAKKASMKAAAGGDSAKAKGEEKATPKKDRKQKDADAQKEVSPKKAAEATASPKKAGAKKRAAPATSPAKEAAPSAAKRGRKAAASNVAVEAQLSEDILKKCAGMGVADSGVSYRSLLEKLLSTKGLADVDQDKALQTLKEHGGLLNRARPVLLVAA